MARKAYFTREKRECIKSLLLTVRIMPSHPHPLLVSTPECQQAQRKYVGHTESWLGVSEAKLKTEMQTDDNTF